MNRAPASKSLLAVPLPEIPKGGRVRVTHIDGESVACQRLREMGFCEQAEIRVINSDGLVVCQVCGARVGLSREVASAVHVEPVP